MNWVTSRIGIQENPEGKKVGSASEGGREPKNLENGLKRLRNHYRRKMGYSILKKKKKKKGRNGFYI